MGSSVAALILTFFGEKSENKSKPRLHLLVQSQQWEHQNNV